MSEQILASKTKSAFLGFFLTNPNRFYSESEIKQQVSGRNLQEDLTFLTKHDFLLKASRKKTDYYRLNQKAFLEPNLRGELAKGAKHFQDLLAKEVGKLRGLELGVFTGIFQGYSHLPSDILLVGKFTEKAIDSFERISKKIVGQELAFTVLLPEEFQYRKDIFDRYIKDVFENDHSTIEKKKTR